MWQQALIDAAAKVNLEAHLVGGGLPGSFVVVSFPPFTLLGEYGEDSHPDYKFSGVKMFVSLYRNQSFEIEMVQLSTRHLHPHVSASDRHMCMGNGETILSDARPSIESANEPSNWIELLIHAVRIVRNHAPGGHYQDPGSGCQDCHCLREFTGEEELDSDNPIDARAIGDRLSCGGCVRVCSGCGSAMSASYLYHVGTFGRASVAMCVYCLASGQWEVCAGCGNVSTEGGIYKCEVTGHDVCHSCGYRVGDEGYVHRSAIVSVVGASERVRCDQASTCSSCRRAVPHLGVGIEAVCGSMMCAMKLHIYETEMRNVEA